MYGKVYRVSVQEDRGANPCVHEMHVCAAGHHFSYMLHVRVMGHLVISAELNQHELTSDFKICPCDRSCRGYAPLHMTERVLGSCGEFGLEEAWAKAYIQLLAKAREISPEECLEMGRTFGYTRFADGDSDESRICTGFVHLSRRCDEFGSGDWFWVTEPCNQFDCRPVRVRLPRLVAQKVREHLPSA